MKLRIIARIAPIVFAAALSGCATCYCVERQVAQNDRHVPQNKPALVQPEEWVSPNVGEWLGGPSKACRALQLKGFAVYCTDVSPMEPSP